MQRKDLCYMAVQHLLLKWLMLNLMWLEKDCVPYFYANQVKIIQKLFIFLKYYDKDSLGDKLELSQNAFQWQNQKYLRTVVWSPSKCWVLTKNNTREMLKSPSLVKFISYTEAGK